MLQSVFPTSLDNQFPGHKIALYVFYALTALTLWRSQHHLFEHDGGAQSIATIPIDTYSSSAAETVVGIFGFYLAGLSAMESLDSIAAYVGFGFARISNL